MKAKNQENLSFSIKNVGIYLKNVKSGLNRKKEERRSIFRRKIGHFPRKYRYIQQVP